MENDFYSETLSRLDRLASEIDVVDGGSHDFTNTAKTLGVVDKVNVKELRTDYGKLKELKDFDESVFASWRVADLPVMLAAGVLGAFSSAALKDFFAELHDKWGSKSAVNAAGEDVWGHGGQEIDRVPGSNRAGGWGHRWKFGHDLFNPFDLTKPTNPLDPTSTPWNQYVEMAKASGTVLPPWLKAVYYWLSHLLQDTFSSEGLPIPGHSLFRGLFDPAKHHELLQFLGTIKMRDVVGTGATNLIMGAYLWGTEKSLERVISKPNYRAFSLMLGANFTNLVTGLYIPPPNTTFNYSTIPMIAYYGIRLYRLERRVEAELKSRGETLEQNDLTITRNLSIIDENEKTIDEMIRDMERYEAEVDKEIRQADELQADIFNRLIPNPENKER